MNNLKVTAIVRSRSEGIDTAVIYGRNLDELAAMRIVTTLMVDMRNPDEFSEVLSIVVDAE